MLSIIIVNYNLKEWLKRYLESLKKAELKTPYEILVIDNASTDSSSESLEKIKENFSNLVVILNQKNLGYAKAVNQGLKLAKGECLFISNPDILITPGSLEKMADFLKNHPEVGVLGPQLRYLDNRLQFSCFSFPRFYTPFIRRTFLKHLPFGKKELDRYLMRNFSHQEIHEVDWLLGSSLMIRKETLEKVGLMDERFFIYFEDIDWCRRFKEKGFKVMYFPEAYLIHEHQRLSSRKKGFFALFDKPFLIHIISAVKYFWKWRKKHCGVV